MESVAQQNEIKSWMIVEIMGHQTVAGFAQTQAFGGTVMLRVDVPDLPEKRKGPKHVWCEEVGKYVHAEELFCYEPGHTQYIGMGSIYRMTPCTEEVARAAAERGRRSMPSLMLLTGNDSPTQALVDQSAASSVPQASWDDLGGDPEADDEDH